MAVANPVPPVSAPDNDIFSISDAHLAQELQFIKEIGAGNWGCVWLCQPKAESSHASRSKKRVAVKLVFREKKPTTAQRVRSLWNEMKIVRSLKDDPHPSIVPFHSFIITPSFAMITMDYLPTLIPVEVPEPKAREWFRCLMSAVLFLHSRGVVHNDIKPANIMLSSTRTPVLVDFGFAEKYDMNSRKAFLSNLAYGTPEYLSPERARGNVHDTRKSDVWSLGITFFEILIGRTPFEYVEGEKFATPQDLEHYWSRTVKGKWVGEWRMSKTAEKLIRRMISPNADIRYTAVDAMNDSYWTETPSYPMEAEPVKQSADKPKVLGEKTNNLVSPTKTPPRPPSKDFKHVLERQNLKRQASKQASFTEDCSVVQPASQAPVLPAITASPITFSPLQKENVPPSHIPVPRNAASKGKGKGAHHRKPVPPLRDSPKAKKRESAVSKEKGAQEKRKSRVFGDITDRERNIENSKEKPKPIPERLQIPGKGTGSIDRVKAFERLKQLERARFMEEDPEEDDTFADDGIIVRAYGEDSRAEEVQTASSAGWTTTTKVDHLEQFVHVERPLETPIEEQRPRPRIVTPEGDASRDDSQILPNDLPRSGNDSSLSLFKQGLKVSIGKTVRLYRSSTLGRSSRQSGRRSSARTEDDDPRLSSSQHESWEDDSFVRNAKSSLPVVRHAMHNEQVAADNKVDRMSMWIRNVEQVVKEAQENFAASSGVTPLPALPVRPRTRPEAKRSGRPGRVPRRILAADRIFTPDVSDVSNVSSSMMQSECISPVEVTHNVSTVLTIPSEDSSAAPITPPAVSPPRQRRVTISSISPDNSANMMVDVETSPLRHEKAKSASHLNRLVRPITPLDMLEKELEKEAAPKPTPSLTSVLDRSIFISRTGSTPPLHEVPSIPTLANASVHFDRVERVREQQVSPTSSTSSRSSRLRDSNPAALLSPARRHIEGVYDRFLMATTGVKRLGKGYQSDNVWAPTNAPTAASYKKSGKIFGTGRRAMPPPISSDDVKAGLDVEFGVMNTDRYSPLSHEGSTKVKGVTKALKAIVTGKTVSKRQSRAI
ncbi:hypothetical protein SCHPADRAFT_859973 [Schizopora paradoxa]|uniref:Protein kinase domain-containing protein n=1 Tax=Schizopora paradoxa TaxID=27342 RepID=A0A0H2R732_9AGAM|nr:hypothetical protein SCHPADRAFT_859973 [Schizopora paradoxa]